MSVTFHKFTLLMLMGRLIAAGQNNPEAPESLTESHAKEAECTRAIPPTIDSGQRSALDYYLELGGTSESRNQFALAEKHYECGLYIAKNLFGERSEELGRVLNHLGEMRLEQGHLSEAEMTFHRALTILESQKTENRVYEAAVLNNIGVAQQMRGNSSRAVTTMREAIAMFQAARVAGERLGTALSNLATTLRQIGRSSEATAAARSAVEVLECCQSSDELPVSLITLGRIYFDSGDSASAEKMYRRALDAVNSHTPGDSATRALAYGHLGVLYGREGKMKEADQYFRDGIEMNSRVFSPAHPKVLDAMSAYASFLRANKRKGEAKKLEKFVQQHKSDTSEQELAGRYIVDAQSLRQNQSR
jgi:tetratricopeptide (TPR) repeat protein